jgi:Lar family restriction alleviation protein
MVTIDIKLKRCPFCGSTAGLYENYDGSYIVQCNYCCIGTIHMKNKQNAIKLWNHRTEVTDND